MYRESILLGRQLVDNYEYSMMWKLSTTEILQILLFGSLTPELYSVHEFWHSHPRGKLLNNESRFFILIIPILTGRRNNE